MEKWETEVQLCLLGDLSLRKEGAALSLPRSRKSRALLAYLALTRKPQRRQSLCELLWTRTDDPRAALRWSLSKLRALLGPALITDRDTIELRLPEQACDLYVLRQVLKVVSATQLPAMVQIEESMGTEYLAGIDCDESANYTLWLESERAALRHLHGELLELLRDDPGANPTRAIHYARKRVGIDPANISANTALLHLLRQHQGVEAARKTFEQCRDRLQVAGINEQELVSHWRTISLQSQPSPNAQGAASTTEPAPTASDYPSIPDKPSLAVLGFRDITGDGNDVLANGLSADLISRLSRLRGLFVIARASSTRFSPQQDSSIEDIGQRLGVRYLILGTTQRHNDRIRVNVQLLEASQSREVWSERYDRARDDLFLLQDEITNAIVSAVEPEIERAEFERAQLKNPENLDAWENYHIALRHSFRFTAADTEATHVYLQRALQLDPQFSRAYAAMSLAHFSRAFLNSVTDTSSEVSLALELAERSVDLDNRDAMGHWSLGRAQFLDRQHDLALESIDRSLQTNPNYAQGHYARGFIAVHAGSASAALGELDAAQRLSPFDPLLFAIKSSRAISLAMQDNYAEAATWATRATLEANAHYHIYAIAAACLELAGRHDEARRQVGIAIKRHPGYSREIFSRSFPYKHAGEGQRISDALQRAGLP